MGSSVLFLLQYVDYTFVLVGCSVCCFLEFDLANSRYPFGLFHIEFFNSTNLQPFRCNTDFSFILLGSSLLLIGFVLLPTVIWHKFVLCGPIVF